MQRVEALQKVRLQKKCKNAVAIAEDLTGKEGPGDTPNRTKGIKI